MSQGEYKTHVRGILMVLLEYTTLHATKWWKYTNCYLGSIFSYWVYVYIEG